MRFFKLTHPRYDTDQEDDSKNPIVTRASHRIPGINCETCGTWSSSDRLRLPLPSPADDFLGVRFLAVQDWLQARVEWARRLQMKPDDIAPGAKLGPPAGQCTAPVREDAVHPMPGEIWIVSRFRDAIVAAELSGVSFAQVQLSPECGAIELWEVVVHGRAWRKGSTDESILLCKICGRRGFPSPKALWVDEARWDGSDFVILDHNPNIIVVTERVVEVLDANSFTNIVAEPVD